MHVKRYDSPFQEESLADVPYWKTVLLKILSVSQLPVYHMKTVCRGIWTSLVGDVTEGADENFQHIQTT